MWLPWQHLLNPSSITFKHIFITVTSIHEGMNKLFFKKKEFFRWDFSMEMPHHTQDNIIFVHIYTHTIQPRKYEHVLLKRRSYSPKIISMFSLKCDHQGNTSLYPRYQLYRNLLTHTFHSWIPTWINSTGNEEVIHSRFCQYFH